MATSLTSIIHNYANSSATLSSPSSSPLTSLAQACRQRYKDGHNFLTVFNPSYQVQYTSQLDRCYLGDSPALSVAAQAFGDEVVESWLMIQVNDLSEYAGCREKLSPGQMLALTRVVRSVFGYLKVTELMHFFLLFKSGKYGRFYGSVDPIAITAALRDYLRDRQDTISRLERERDRRARQEQAQQDAAAVAAFNEKLRSQGLTFEQWKQSIITNYE